MKTSKLTAGLFAVASCVTLTGCIDEAFEQLNDSPIGPPLICEGEAGFGLGFGGARKCHIGVGGTFPVSISDAGSFIPPTSGEVASISVDTRASTAPIAPGAIGQVKITLLNLQSQTIASKTFAASINNGILKVADPTAVSLWLAGYPQAAQINFDASIDKINEAAGQTNSFVMTLKYLGASLSSAGVIWSAPCYYDPDSGITSSNQCVFGGT
ncbi:MAG: hypothetical protein ACOZAA_11740 [Pseudomonadota bacterium]